MKPSNFACCCRKFFAGGLVASFFSGETTRRQADAWTLRMDDGVSARQPRGKHSHHVITSVNASSRAQSNRFTNQPLPTSPAHGLGAIRPSANVHRRPAALLSFGLSFFRNRPQTSDQGCAVRRSQRHARDRVADVTSNRTDELSDASRLDGRGMILVTIGSKRTSEIDADVPLSTAGRDGISRMSDPLIRSMHPFDVSLALPHAPKRTVPLLGVTHIATTSD
jgi:hypothetical protein